MFYWIENDDDVVSKECFETSAQAIESAVKYAKETIETSDIDWIEIAIVEDVEKIKIIKENIYRVVKQ